MKKNTETQGLFIPMEELLEIDLEIRDLNATLYETDDPLEFEKMETEAKKGYTFIDIRNNPKERTNKFPTTVNYSKQELLTNYENILQKGVKYVLVDHWGNAAPFIQTSLLYFGYQIYVIEGGLMGYRKFRRENRNR